MPERAGTADERSSRTGNAVTRTELYERVWQTPMRTLARELGISDVGLAKACKRLAIPTPRAGHWTKVAAGKPVPQPRLPIGEDVQIILSVPSTDLDLRARAAVGDVLAARRELLAATELTDVVVRPSLEGCHPMVAKTAKFFAGIRPAIEKAEREAERAIIERRPNFAFMNTPRTSFGRYTSSVDGGLRIATTLARVDWSLRFHDALLRGLQASGCKLLSIQERESVWLEVSRGTEGVRLSFAEDYEKRATGEFAPRDTCRLKMEPPVGAPRHWRGRQSELEDALPEIVRDIVVILQTQPARRRARDDDEAARAAVRDQAVAERRATEDRERIRRERKRSRKAQAARALDVGKAQLRYEATLRVLADIEARAPAGVDGEGLRTWLKVAREGLKAPVGELLAELGREISRDARPDWWPEL